MPAREFRWTNVSVRQFAENQNPIEKMEQVARAFVLDAMECGWSGPPFDPVELATFRNIRVRPNASISDARVFVVNDSFTIEYNPHKSKGRVNYSIAHEIAHTFFPDCKDNVRNRGAQAPDTSNWQLEMLCNIGAAEILMPVGVFPTNVECTTSIEELMRIRKEFQVSAEAVLIRLVKLASSPIACFAASRVEYEDEFLHRIDYCIGSKLWASFERSIRKRTVSSQVLDECVAIGTTSKGNESWLDEYPDLRVEGVALPPYPGANALRVVGLIRPTVDTPQVGDVEYRLGNAAEFPSTAATAIIHVVNDKAKSWGGFGFAQALKTRYPEAFQDYRDWTIDNPDHHKLGNLHVAFLPENKYVVSVIAQAGYGPTTRPRIRYGALDTALEVASERLQELGVATVQMPRIGSGQAGGNWEVIVGIVRERLVSSGLNVRVLDLP